MKPTTKAARWEIVFAVALGTALVCFMSGCSTTASTGRTWYNPTTWFSGSELRKIERTEVKLSDAKAVLLESAQKTAHETQIALAVAPPSRAVEVARESNDTTVASLDQLAGPLTVEQSFKLRLQVAGLLSEVLTERAKAESERQSRREVTMEASTTISELNAKVVKQAVDLKAGFERENATANKYRNLVFAFYAILGVAALLTAGLIYIKYALGGIPMAIGRGLSTLRAENPKAGKLATTIFDGILNRNEQKIISKNS